jgi:hypothetical protein
MANRILLQTLLRFSDQIKSGAAKVQDVVTDYFNQTGKSVTDEERGIILKEFQDNAPSNVEPIDFGQNIKGIYDEAQGPGAGDAMVEALKSPGAKKSKEIMEEALGVTLRGDETFGELMEMKNALKTKEADQGLGSLYPKGKPGEIFDEANSKRDEMAGFMKAMRAAGIKNEDVMNTAKITDVAEGKRAATTLARAADMGADTKIKQEILSELDDDIANYGPDWWRGMGYNDGPMGRESVGNLLENLTTTVNNGIYDDLIERGVPEDKVSDIFQYIARIRDNVKYDPKALVRKIAEDLELEDIKYDTTFWDNYLNEILTRIQKPEPRFADGGLV